MTYLRQPWVHTRSAEFRWIHLFLRWPVTGVMIKKELELSDWEAYYQASEQRGQSPLLSRALSLISANEGARQAVDLGCGAGMETRQLLAAGWDVLAIDREAGAIARTSALSQGVSGGRLATLACDFEQLTQLPASRLIHAGLALPFCRPEYFETLWRLVTAALEPGGVFVGHLFGERHGWAALAHMTFQTEAQARLLCGNLELHLLREFEQPGASLQGDIAWHRFDIIASKPQGDDKYRTEQRSL